MVNSRNIEIANLGLIGISLALALMLPFRFFLFAYAVLGPLHYLTELNWLHEKKYFVKNRTWLLVSLLLVGAVAFPKVAQFIGLGSNNIVAPIIGWMDSVSNGAIFLGLWLAFVLVSIKSAKWQLVLGGVGLLVAYLLNTVPIYTVMVGAMVPTVIHVYVFTGLFMFYGALKSKSVLGYLATAALLLVPIIVWQLDVNPKIYDIPSFAKETFIENGFYKVNISLAKLFEITDGKNFLFYGAWELKVQTFLAFAYVYHYLNWFSKTAIIGWHKSINQKKAIAILAVWMAHVTLF
ncbi:MAG: hypothetical protein ACPGD8_08145, partial [Flavobacteriales bacterium]